MTFWLCVFAAYAVLLAVGLRLGLWLADRFPPKGGRGPVVEPTPEPDPTFGVDWTDFDRDLFPGLDLDAVPTQRDSSTLEGSRFA